MNQSKEKVSDRQTTILEAATAAFTRYGYKKTSLDDVATAAGISRQGLYLHFASKADLFRSVVIHVVEQSRAQRHKVLADREIEVEIRLLKAFVLSHGTKVGSDNFRELLAAAYQLVGDVLHESEKQFAAEVTSLLKEIAVTTHWRTLGLSAKQIAELLFAASTGIQQTSKNPAEYRRHMKVAVQVMCG